MKHLYRLTTLALLCVFFAGCAMTRTTTTDRTAVEVALLTQTASESVKTLEIPPLSARSYALVDEAFDAPEKDFILSEFHELLLRANGHRIEEGADEADLLIEPRVNFAHIDDDKFLLGIPSIPIPIPGAGALVTPEIAIFGLETQKGRSRFSLFGQERESGALVFADTAEAREHRFRRYTFLIFFKFRTTTLPRPF